MKIQADIVNGCYLVDDFDSDVTVLNEYDFYDQLHILETGIIASEIYDEMYFKIYNEYGIH